MSPGRNRWKAHNSPRRLERPKPREPETKPALQPDTYKFVLALIPTDPARELQPDFKKVLEYFSNRISIRENTKVAIIIKPRTKEYAQEFMAWIKQTSLLQGYRIYYFYDHQYLTMPRYGGNLKLYRDGTGVKLTPDQINNFINI